VTAASRKPAQPDGNLVRIRERFHSRDQSKYFGLRSPGRGERPVHQRDVDAIARFIEARGKEAQAIDGDVQGHGVFMPRQIAETDPHRNGQAPARAGTMLVPRARAIASGSGEAACRAKLDGDTSFPFIGSHPHDTRGQFRRIGKSPIEGKCHPKRSAGRVRVIRFDERAPPRYIQDLAHLDDLPERPRPAEPDGQGQLYSVMTPPLHGQSALPTTAHGE